MALWEVIVISFTFGLGFSVGHLLLSRVISEKSASPRGRVVAPPPEPEIIDKSPPGRVLAYNEEQRFAQEKNTKLDNPGL